MLPEGYHSIMLQINQVYLLLQKQPYQLLVFQRRTLITIWLPYNPLWHLHSIILPTTVMDWQHQWTRSWLVELYSIIHYLKVFQMDLSQCIHYLNVSQMHRSQCTTICLTSRTLSHSLINLFQVMTGRVLSVKRIMLIQTGQLKDQGTWEFELSIGRTSFYDPHEMYVYNDICRWRYCFSWMVQLRDLMPEMMFWMSYKYKL